MSSIPGRTYVVFDFSNVPAGLRNKTFSIAATVFYEGNKGQKPGLLDATQSHRSIASGSEFGLFLPISGGRKVSIALFLESPQGFTICFKATIPRPENPIWTTLKLVVNENLSLGPELGSVEWLGEYGGDTLPMVYESSIERRVSFKFHPGYVPLINNSHNLFCYEQI